MAEHAGQDRKSTEPAASRVGKAKPSSTPHSELLNRRSDALLGPAIQFLDRRAALTAATAPQPVQPKERPNRTGLPDRLKAGVEALSGLSMDDVRVHRNSSKPAQLQAHAFAQGTDIHLGPGQEKHLPHEAWHVVQQKQGRVQASGLPTGGAAINNDPGLEEEADAMGLRALVNPASDARPAAMRRDGMIQRMVNQEDDEDFGEFQAAPIAVGIGEHQTSERGLLTEGLANCIAILAVAEDGQATLYHWNTGVGAIVPDDEYEGEEDEAGQVNRRLRPVAEQFDQARDVVSAGLTGNLHYEVVLGGLWNMDQLAPVRPAVEAELARAMPGVTIHAQPHARARREGFQLIGY